MFKVTLLFLSFANVQSNTIVSGEKQLQFVGKVKSLAFYLCIHQQGIISTWRFRDDEEGEILQIFEIWVQINALGHLRRFKLIFLIAMWCYIGLIIIAETAHFIVTVGNNKYF